MFADLRAATARALANRYQELCEQADRSWQDLKATGEGKDAKMLHDAGQEALRQLLHDPNGPFALPTKPESYYSAETTAELKRQREDMASLEKSFTPLPEAMAVAEGKVENLRVHIRGNHLTLGDVVPREFLHIISGDSQTPLDDQRSGRLELANWITRPDHPLTSRVMVNRIWQWHFGAGLVRSSDNFGRLGERPTNQPLLDWLARRFVERGWSVKAMHRLVMLSATYQMSTAYDERAAQADPENRLYWRMNRRRLEAEAIRDAILATSGQLDRTMGGSLFTGNNRAYVPGYPNTSYGKYDFPRRSIYLPVIRSDLYDVFQAFDFADPSSSSGERATTTVAPQALFMMNSRIILEQTKYMATSLLGQSELDDAGRVRLAYTQAYSRPASEQDVTRSLDFLRRYEAALAAQHVNSDDRRLRTWQALCRSVLSSNEFLFVE